MWWPREKFVQKAIYLSRAGGRVKLITETPALRKRRDNPARFSNAMRLSDIPEERLCLFLVILLPRKSSLPGRQLVSQDRASATGVWEDIPEYHSRAASTHLPGVLIFNPCADVRMKGEVWGKVFKVLCDRTSKRVTAQRQRSPASRPLQRNRAHSPTTLGITRP